MVTAAGVVTTLAGSAGQIGSADGTGSAARFSYPQGVAVDGTGNVYVADYYNNTIRKVTSASVVTTAVGSYSSVIVGTVPGPLPASLYQPLGVAVSQVTGDLYITVDSAVLVATDPLSIAPATATVDPGLQTTFTASGGLAPYIWFLSVNASGGSISSTGVYTAGATGGVGDVVTVFDSLGASASATVTVPAPLTVTSGGASAVSIGSGGQLTLAVSGGSGPFTWTISSNGSGGSISSSGIYSAGPNGGTDIVTVTDSSGKSATITITVSVEIWPTAVVDLGTMMWPSVAMASTGEIYVAGSIPGSALDAAVRRYDLSGRQVWSAAIADVPPGFYDQTASGLAVSDAGQVAIIGQLSGLVQFGAGQVSTVGSIWDGFVAAFNREGSPLWLEHYDLGSGGFQAIAGSAVNGTARFGVCGTTSRVVAELKPGPPIIYPPLTNTEAVIAVFGESGQLLWASQFGSPSYFSNADASCSALALDQEGNLYATGQYGGSAYAFLAISGPNGSGNQFLMQGPSAPSSRFAWIAKFGPTGNVLGATNVEYLAGGLPEIGHHQTRANAIALGANGAVYVAGSFAGQLGPSIQSVSPNDDAFLVGLDGSTLASTGGPVRFGGSGSDQIRSLATTSRGDVLAVGTVSRSSGFRSTFGHDTSGAVGLDVQGQAFSNLFIAGFSGSTLASQRAVTYGTAGNVDGLSIAVNRALSDVMAFTASVSGSATFGGAGSISTPNASALVIAAPTAVMPLAITPATAIVEPGLQTTFTAYGGSGPYTWTLTTNGSGGSVSPGGVYTAGPGGGTDVLTVTDGNGGTATVTITVTPGQGGGGGGGEPRGAPALDPLRSALLGVVMALLGLLTLGARFQVHSRHRDPGVPD
jgi:hypothetical protein